MEGKGQRVRSGPRARRRQRRLDNEALEIAQPLPTRDLLADEREAAAFRDLVINSGVAIVPLVAVLLFVVKLIMQTHGDANIAVAVITNMTLGSVAFVLLLTLLPYLMAGVAAGSAKVYFNPEYAGNVRRIAGVACVVSMLILLLTQPWWLFAAALLFVVIERFAKGQEPVSRVTLDEWARLPAPLDHRLRQLWIDLRAHQRSVGQTLPSRRGDVGHSDVPLRTSDEIATGVRERYAEIAAPRAKTPLAAIYTTLITIITVSGITLITGPVKLAPLEHLTLENGDAVNGYIFAGSPDRALVLDVNGTSAEYVEVDQVEDRYLCESAAAFLESTVTRLIAGSSLPDCPTDAY